MAERLQDATRELSMEAALLVASAMGKGIDVSVWLMEASAKDTTVEHFNDRLISLALSVGIEEDWDTKRELEVAVSTKSLKNIKSLFACGANGAFIDVTMFLNVAQQKVVDYMASLEGNNESNDSQEEREADLASQLPVVPSSRSAGGTIISSVGGSVSGNSWDGEADEPEEDDEVNIADDESVEENLEVDQYNPTSPPALRVHSTQKDIFHSPSLSNRPGDSATNALLPDSPYDEEVAFDLDEEEEADTADGYSKRRKPVVSNLMQQSSGKPTVPKLSSTDARALSSPKKSSPIKKEASPTSPTTQGRASPSAEAAAPLSDSKASAAARRIKGGSFTRAAREIVAEPPLPSSNVAALRPKSAVAAKSKSMSSSLTRPSSAGKNSALNASRNSLLRMSTASMASSLYPADIVQVVEDQVRNVVQRTDLYHLVQVHLGFIDTYTMVPHRGAAVISMPRARLSVNDLQTAFFQARTRFTEAQILAIMKLVTRYAREKVGDEKSEEEINAEVVAPGARLSSDWLKKYMVHLRLTKKKTIAAEEMQVGSSLEKRESISANIRASRDEPLQFNTWLGAKLVEDRKEMERKPKEFQKALAGQKHILNREELENYLAQHNIIPSDLLKEEITLRVQSWSLDISGRKDYTHAWNLAVRKWDKEHVSEDYRRLKEDRKKEVSAQIRTALLRDHADSLRKSEKEKQAITRDLFWKFQRAASKAQVGMAPTWGQWLTKHQASESQLIVRSKQDSEERSRLMAKRKERKQTVAPLVEIEKKFNEAADKLTTYHSIELRKCLVGLRKRAIAAGIGTGDKLLVSKDLFDSQMADVLAPRMQQLDPELRGFAEEARKSHEGMGSTANSDAQFACLVDAIFKEDYKQADIKAAEIQLLNEEQADLEFKEWEERKVQQKQTTAEKIRQKNEAIEEEKKKRQKVADKAYKQWLKLRKTGRYVSRVDKKAHALPETNRVDHDGRWSKDVEIIHPEVSYL